ncbi:MAG: putative toxin-antitoxin system toxin component, PIN family [bacterium]
MRVVIDTNIVFAGLANRKGAAFKIYQRFFRGQFDWSISQQILDEYHGVLSLSQKITPTSVHIFLHLLRKRSVIVQIAGNL